MAEEGQDASQRGRSRKNVIAHSPHKDEYVRLLKLGWSSTAISKFALFRYGEDIPERTVRNYRRSIGIQVLRSEMRGVDVDPDVIMDILAERAELLALQKARIAIDTKHERDMQKLFSGTRHEVEVANRLISDAKADMQDYGLFPKLGELHHLRVTGQVQGLTPQAGEQPALDGPVPPAAQTLGEVIGPAVTPEVEQQLARMLHDLMPTDPQVNGHGVVEGEVEAG
jgi:hypothetical protein